MTCNKIIGLAAFVNNDDDEKKEKKWHSGTERQTDKDSNLETESGQWADSEKILSSKTKLVLKICRI